LIFKLSQLQPPQSAQSAQSPFLIQLMLAHVPWQTNTKILQIVEHVLFVIQLALHALEVRQLNAPLAILTLTDTMPAINASLAIQVVLHALEAANSNVQVAKPAII